MFGGIKARLSYFFDITRYNKGYTTQYSSIVWVVCRPSSLTFSFYQCFMGFSTAEDPALLLLLDEDDDEEDDEVVGVFRSISTARESF